MIRGKSQPPKQLMNAVAMESANRAYVQQTLNRLKDIATGRAPDITNEILPEEERKNQNDDAKKSTSAKSASGSKKTTSKRTGPTAITTPKEKKVTVTAKKVKGQQPAKE
jgi:hypothetical protein